MNVSMKRALKRFVHKSGIYAPIIPLCGGLNHIAYLTMALAWSRSKSKSGSGTIKDEGMDFARRYELYEYLKRNHKLDEAIDYLEFGVYQGASIKWWVNNNLRTESRFIGFDTFSGLPEDWGSLKKGHYTALGKVPVINDGRVQFIRGLFQETLDSFLIYYPNDRRKVIHMDADLYSSTLFVLTRIGPLLKKNDILIFDEFLAWKYPTHEFRAFCDFVDSYQVNYKLIGAAEYFAHVAIKIL